MLCTEASLDRRFIEVPQRAVLLSMQGELKIFRKNSNVETRQ
jgi:hypothetical protein